MPSYRQVTSRGGRWIVAGLGAVSLLLATAEAAQLSLTWSDMSSNEDGFRIQRKTGSGGAYATIATPPAGTTGYVDGTVTAGTTYCYRVSAYNSAGDSSYSNEACAAPVAATTHAVTVTRAGTGSGTVTSSPNGIICGTDCTEAYASGTSVGLSATPATGSTFTGWSGAYTGTGGCALVVDGPKNLTATFALQTHALTITKSGTGTGTVTATGINCGADCTETYNYNTSVSLTAAATTGSTFTGWGGACTGTGTCVVSMTAARTVTATFTPTASSTYTLTVTKGGTGTGTVTSNSTGINCGTDCTQNYASGTSVTLTAAATTGSTFTGWGGACTGTGTCVVSMTAARTVTATFTPTASSTYTLTVTKGGTGTGTVTSNSTGINCGTDCTQNYASGTSVTLTAAATTGSTFTGWTGACSGTGTCVVGMTAARTVTATFTPSAPSTYTLTVTKAGIGVGTVTSNPSGIACGATCTTSFNSGTSVTLTAAATTGSTFTGWTGACAGTGPCTLSMSQARSVTATFGTQTAQTTYTIWPNTATPTNPSDPEAIALELGVKFRASVNGYITGIRFYKGPMNTGTHVGSLWTSAGTLLARATFTNETASGWQQVTFATPVAITANTTYVASYHTNVGRYAGDNNYFATAGVTNGPLTALGNGVSGGNGVYRAGATSVFPNQTWLSSNYWVDVVFTTNTAGYPFSVTKAGTGSGTVTSNPAGITCGSDCTESYASGTSVTLAVTPGNRSTFAGWSGACSGTGTCTVSLTEAKSVTATFKRRYR